MRAIIAALLMLLAQECTSATSMKEPVVGKVNDTRVARVVTVPTLTTDCDDVLFPSRIDKNKQSTQHSIMCIWMPDGSCIAAMDQYYLPVGARPITTGRLPTCSFDGSHVNLTSVEVLEALPVDTSIIYITHLGIQRLGSALDIDPFDVDKTQLPILDLVLSDNNISAIENVTFPNQLRNLYDGLSLAPTDLIDLVRSMESNNIRNNAVRLNQTATLKTLNLSFNRISNTSNLTLPSGLEVLNMSGNALSADLSFPSAPSLEVLDLSSNNISSTAEINWPQAITTLYLDGNKIEDLFLRFPPTLHFLCIGRNPLNRITATKKMLDHFRSFGVINDPAKCPHANVSYPLLSCAGRSCTKVGPLVVQMVQDAAADGALFPTNPEDGRLATLYISIVVFCAALVVVSIAVWMEIKRRERGKEASWHSAGTPGNRPTLADSSELLDDIRFDPSYKSYHIPSSAVSRDRLLARGGYGVVYLGTWRADKGPPVQVAMKRLLPEKLAHAHNIEDFMDEIRLNCRLRHPNIVTLYGYTWTSLHNLSMVTEYMSHGDLWALLEQDRRTQALPWNIASHFRLNWSAEPNAVEVEAPTSAAEGLVDASCELSKERLLRDVVQALAYLHSQDIIHRDLKAKNVMLGPSYVAKLTDFGTSRSCSTDDDETMTAEIGTVAWIAPEILKGVRYCAKADIYSLGVLLSEMDTQEVPYSNARRRQSIYDSSKAVDVAKARIAMLVVAGELKPDFTSTCPPCIFVIAQRCLAYNPDDRPSAVEVLAWLNQLRQPVHVL